MCFIVAVVGLFLGYNFLLSSQYFLGVGSFVGSVFFIYLMIKNILYVKSLKEEKKNDN